MKTIKQLLSEKGANIYSISPDATVYQALQLLAEKDIGALLVIEDESVVGIISERDYARKVILSGKSSKDTYVKDIMTPDVICINLAQSVEECMAIMTQKHIRHLPVLEGSRLMGVISIGDVVKSIITEQGFLIDHLVSYITGR